MTILLTRIPEMPLTSRLILTATVTTLLLCSLLSGKTVSAQQADLILHGGKVVTVDAEFSIAEAIAVRGDRIVAVGADADVLALAGEKTTPR